MAEKKPVPTWWVDFCARSAIFLAAALGLFVLTSPWPDTPDGLFHLHRVRALAEALRWGTLYPRWFPDFAFGYGYPVLNFYAPLFYYPPALLHLAHLDIITATRMTLAFFYALSGVVAYGLLRRWVRPAPAFVGAVLYLTFPYHLYDLFVRGALPEFAAFLWPPLTLHATLGALHAGQRHPSRLALASLAWAGLLLTHNLTALMWIPLVAVGILPLAARQRRLGRDWIPILIRGWMPMLVGGLLAGFYVVPVLLEMPWVGIGAVPGGSGYERHFAGAADLFTWAAAYPYPPASQPTVPLPAYTAVLLLLGLVLVILRFRHERAGPLAAMLGLAVLSLWLSTRASAPLWRVLGPLSSLQFPWRWHAILALALAALLALACNTLLSRPRFTVVLLYAAITAYLTFYALGELRFAAADIAPASLTPEQMWAFDREHGQVGASWTAEFLPRWVTEQRWAIGRPPTAAEPELRPAIHSLRLESVGYLSRRGTYGADSDGLLLFHTFYYPAWRVQVDGRDVPTRPISSLGLLAATVPAGEHAFQLRWEATPAVQVGRVCAALGWLAVFFLLIWGKRPRPRPGLVLWVAVGLVMLLGSLDLTARQVRPHPVQADYGPLVLTAARVERSGDEAHVVLYWFVRRRPEPVTAFVHVLNESGRVVAQHDGPIGGGYTPVARWFPGLLLPDPHPISLNLPPGTYRLKAGLYRPGYADQPLRAAGASPADPRVDIGVIEVRP